MDSTSTHVQFQFADSHLFKFIFKCQCEIRPSTAYVPCAAKAPKFQWYPSSTTYVNAVCWPYNLFKLIFTTTGNFLSALGKLRA